MQGALEPSLEGVTFLLYSTVSYIVSIPQRETKVMVQGNASNATTRRIRVVALPLSQPRSWYRVMPVKQQQGAAGYWYYPYLNQGNCTG